MDKNDAQISTEQLQYENMMILNFNSNVCGSDIEGSTLYLTWHMPLS